MSSRQLSPFLKSWYFKWKALRLPWRKRFLIGLDLQGNTYWEFSDIRNANNTTTRMRRIVEYPAGTHMGEVKVPPQWHQWLRHMRERPPSLQEQHAEVRRQAQIKLLAAQADARWEAKERLVGPASTSSIPALGGGGRGPTERTAGGNEAGQEGIASTVKEQVKAADPWKQHRPRGPSEDWQPQGWSPPSGPKR